MNLTAPEIRFLLELVTENYKQYMEFEDDLESEQKFLETLMAKLKEEVS